MTETNQNLTLPQIEEELGAIVATDKTSWVRIYELMEVVESETLYKGSFKSFTAWVNHFASKCNVHVSLLWSRKKAGKMYSEYQTRAADRGAAVPDMSELKVSPDNFVLIEKIAGSDTAVADDLTDKVINGTLKRQDLKNAWATVRENRGHVRLNGHKPKAAAEQDDSGDKEKKQSGEQHTQEGQNQPSEKPITATDIVFALSKNDWLPLDTRHEKAFQSERYKVLTEFAVDTGTSHHARRIDAFVTENITTKERGAIALHGIEIKVSKSDLLGDHKMQEYTDFVDYFWIAVPQNLVEDVLSIKTPSWGVISVNKTGAEVVAAATIGRPVFRDKTLEGLVMKLL